MRPLVLIHGFTGSPSSFDLVLDELDELREVLLPIVLGHGPGSTSSRVVTFRDEVDRIAKQIAEWASEPVYVVGYSLGARLALGMLLQHPALFGGAALVGVNPGLRDRKERVARAAADDRWRAILDRGDLAGFIDAWNTQPLFLTQQRLPAEVLEHQRRARLSHAARGLSLALQVLGLAAMPDYWTELGRASRPIDILVGSEDAKFLAIAREVANLVPTARLHVVPGAGHNLLLESPDDVARVIRKGIES